MHEKHTTGRPGYALSNEEAYHWSRALSAFNRQLYRVPHGDEAAALLTTAAMVGIVTFQHIEATKPEEAWPLAPPSSSDLAWLRMTDGKKEVFKLTQRGTADPSPLLEKLTALYLNTDWQRASSPYQRPGEADASALLLIFALYDIDPATKADDTDDPLRWASARLAQLLAQDTPPRQVVTSFLLVISAMRPDFRRMLHEKDPRALLLLAWWYTKTSQLETWWLDRRSKLEGAAICMYLAREYPHDQDMQKLLEHPRSVFGLGAAR
jgi:hypothetical protein